MSIEKPSLLRTQAYQDLRGSLRPVHLPQKLESWHQFNLVTTASSWLRGLHFQDQPWDQGKLVTVIEGQIRDICINLDDSEIYTFDMQAGDVLWVPRGYAHGFCSLSDSLVMYLLDNAYRPEAAKGVNPFCEELNLNWGVDYPMAIERDLQYPKWSQRYESL